MGGIAVGGKVPEFTLKDQNGKDQSFYKDILPKGAALVVFYPGDFTMVCTKLIGVKNSPPSCAPVIANLPRKYS